MSEITDTLGRQRYDWSADGLVPLTEVARRAGVSYRRVDYWCRTVPGVPQPGYYDQRGNRVDNPDRRYHGYTRCVTDDQATRIVQLAALVIEVGLPISKAAQLDDDHAVALLAVAS